MSKKWLVALSGLLLAAGLLIYGKTFGYGFVFDDFEFIVTNPFIKNFNEMSGFWRIGFPKTRLITLYTFAANYFVNGLNPAGYHIFNFVMHVITAFCAWYLAHVLLHWQDLTAKSLKRFFPDERSWMAFFAALLFLVHPVQTQAVTYVTQRFVILTTLFYMLSVVFYIHGRRVPGVNVRKIILWVLSALAAVAAIMSKEEAITLPIMILFIELYLFGKPEKTGVKGQGASTEQGKAKKRISLPQISVQSYIITGLGVLFLVFFLWLFRGTIYTYVSWQANSESHDGDVLTVGTYLLTQIRVLMTFVRLMVLPVKQTLEYDYPMSHGFFELPVITGAIGFILLIAAFIRLRKKHSLISFGIAWVLITFSANLFPRVNVIFEHKLYLISFGFCLIVVEAADHFIRNARWRQVVLMAVVVCLSVVSFARNDVWRTELSLWTDVVAKSPNKARPNANMGKALLERREYEKALRYLDRSIELNPRDNRAITNRGSVYFALHDYEKALVNYQMAMEIDPGYFGTFINRGLLYMETGKLQEAMQDFNQAVALDPKFHYAYVKRGHLLRQLGRAQEALQEFNHALAIDNVDLEALIGRAIVYFDLKENAKALADFDLAISLAPVNGRLYLDRGFFYLNQGETDKALADFDLAVKYDPLNPEAYAKRGMARKAKGQTETAMQDFDKALQIDPAHIVSRNNRMAIYFERKQFDKALEESNQAIAYAPFLDYLYKNRGMVRQAAGMVDQSVGDFTMAISKAPSNSEPYFLRGTSYFILQQFDNAAADFSKVIELEPGNSAAYNNRGIIRSMRQDYDGAITDFNKAITIAPAYSAPYWGKALALAGQSEYKEAVDFAKKAESMGHPVDHVKMSEWQGKL